MKSKIKNFPKKWLIGFGVFFIAILLFSVKTASAITTEDWIFNPVGTLLDASGRIALSIVSGLITFGLSIIQIITAAFCYVGAILVKWVVTAPVRLTSGGVVDVGWAFCRDFANMFFIVILLVIAYATMLKMETYGMKRTLIPLIIMALLINFSQMIAGVVIDISNIFMNFFIQNGAADAGMKFIEENTFMKDVMGVGTEKFWGNFLTMFNKDFAEYASWTIGVAFKALFGVIFNIIECLVLLAYGLILTLRIVVIWILVILSPLAFISYVLPATRSFWSMWWKNFIQWATIGIILLFFLYFGNYLMAHSSDIEFFASCKMTPVDDPATPDPTSWGAAIMSEFFCSVLPSIAGLVFLLLGLFLGFQGAGGMPSSLQKIVQTPTRWVGGKAGEAAKTGSATLGLKAMGRINEKGEWTPTTLGKIVKGVEKAPVVGNLVGGQGATRTFLESQVAATKGLEKRHTEDLEERLTDLTNKKLKGPGDWAEIKNIIGILTQRGKIREFRDESGLTDDKIRELLRVAQQLGADIAPAVKQIPELADVIGKTPAEILAKINSQDYVKLFDPNSIKTDIIFNNTDSSQLNAVFSMGTAEQRQAAAKKINDTLSGSGLPYQAGSEAIRLQGMTEAKKGQEINMIRQAVVQADLAKKRGITNPVEAEKFHEMIVQGIINKNAKF